MFLRRCPSQKLLLQQQRLFSRAKLSLSSLNNRIDGGRKHVLGAAWNKNAIFVSINTTPKSFFSTKSSSENEKGDIKDESGSQRL